MPLPQTKLRSSLNSAMFTLGREARGLSQAQLAEAAKVPQAAISRMEAGQAATSTAHLTAIASALQFPATFFGQGDTTYPFGSSTFYHRKQASVPAYVLRKVQAWINIYRIHVLKLMRVTDFDSRCRFPRFDVHSVRSQRELAGLLRSNWRLPSGPIPDLVNAIECAGGVVIRFDFGTPKMFGVSEWIPPAPPLFFLNDNAQVSGDRDRFTLAHEIAHVVLHSIPNPSMEKQADVFAAEFLMPEREIRAHLRTPLKLEKLLELKKYWKVSMQAILEHAFTLGVLNERQREYLWTQIAARGYKMREPIEIGKEQPNLVKSLLRVHLLDLGYTLDELCDMLCIRKEEFSVIYPQYEEPRIRLVK